MQKNVASKLVVFAFDSTTNLPVSGDAANITASVSIDFGTDTDLGDTSATELSSTKAKGYYLFDLAQAETNGDTLVFSARSVTSNVVVIAVPAVVFTTAPNFSATAISAAGGVTLADGVSHGGTLGSSTATLAMDRIYVKSVANDAVKFECSDVTKIPFNLTNGDAAVHIGGKEAALTLFGGDSVPALKMFGPGASLAKRIVCSPELKTGIL